MPLLFVSRKVRFSCNKTHIIQLTVFWLAFSYLSHFLKKIINNIYLILIAIKANTPLMEFFILFKQKQELEIPFCFIQVQSSVSY